MGFSLRASVQQRMATQLTLGQKLQIKAKLFDLRLDLIGNVHGGNYKPRAVCPNCTRSLTPLEIIAGFRNDPMDYTTECTQCHKRFAPQLVYKGNVADMELPFYCNVQVLAQLGGLEELTPEEIQKKHPAIYHSVRVHHGNFRVAFAKVGVQYTFETVTDWKEKVQEFLGKLPDTVIAKAIDLPVKTVRRLRNSLGISSFVHRDALE